MAIWPEYLGDGVLVYFGDPMAHEDDVHWAGRTGLGLLNALESLTTRLALPPGERVAVRLGVHTGVVGVGDVGGGGRHEPLVRGETPNIAVRLQQVAAPNTLMTPPPRVTSLRAISHVKCWGATAPRPWRSLCGCIGSWGPGAQSRLEVAASRGLTPLVGRVPEVGLLVERWGRVKAGMGQVVVLTGETPLPAPRPDAGGTVFRDGSDPAGVGVRCAVHRYRALSRHGDDVLATPGRGRAGAGERLTYGTGGFAKRVYCHGAEKRTEERGAHCNGPPLRVAIAEALPKLPLEAREGLEIAQGTAVQTALPVQLV